MKSLLAVALLVAAGPLAAQTVKASDTDWSYLPQMRHVSNNHLDHIMLAGVHDVIKRGECKIDGQYADNVDLTVPFATQITSEGKVNQLVVRKLDCPEIEGIVAGALLKMLEGGDYKPLRSNAEGWYQGEFSFASKG